MSNIQEVTAYKWQCPYYNQTNISMTVDDAKHDSSYHIAECSSNPSHKLCRSCIHHQISIDHCKLHNRWAVNARANNENEDYDCNDWDCKPELLAIQKKLHGANHD